MGPIKFKPLCPIGTTPEMLMEHTRINLPKYPAPPSLDGEHLAVVGAGPSLDREIETLRRWPGPIWAVNGACWVLRQHKIDSWFFSVDPKPIVADLAKGAERVILGAACNPSIFEALKHADVRRFDVLAMPRGPTSASSTPYLAVSLGAREVTYFGCECSYEDTTHCYMSERVPHLFEAECDGKLFLTKPELAVQAEFLAQMIRAAPQIFHERCGGFLRALVNQGSYGITRISRELEELRTK